MKKRFTEEQIVGFLREEQIGGKTVEQLGREDGFSQNSFYTWKRKCGAMDGPDMKRLRELMKAEVKVTQANAIYLSVIIYNLLTYIICAAMSRCSQSHVSAAICISPRLHGPMSPVL